MRTWNTSVGEHEMRARKEVSSVDEHKAATGSMSSMFKGEPRQRRK